MKAHTVAGTAAVLLLAGCLKFPETPQELRSMTGSETVEVSRSPSSVMSTLASRGKACLTLGVSTSITSVGGPPGQGMMASFQDSYRTRVSGRTFIVEHNSPNNIGSPGWYPRIVANVTAVAGGSRVTVHAPFGEGDKVDAIQSWVRGDTRPCPRNEI